MNFKTNPEFPEFSSIDNIKVCVRVRPMNIKEKEDNCKESIETNLNQIIINLHQKSQKQFNFDKVFDQSYDQEDIFKRIGQTMVESFLNGFNSTIFAYGQTGAGKTHTMIGNLNMENHFGLLPRCLEYIFYCLNNSSKEFNLRISFIEIYNEKIIDLLSDFSDVCFVTIREDLKKGVYLEGAKEDTIVDFQTAISLLKKGFIARHTSSTNMNHESSRSHSIFTIYCQTTSTENQCSSVKNSVFNFIDLAGSERHKDTQTTGDRFKEGCNINKSLTVLGSVIHALSDRRSKLSSQKSFVRYRDSKLTHLLKNSLGGNSKTVFIANVSPACKYSAENLSTLLFAQRAKKVQNSARMNEQFKASSIVALTAELNKTKQELHVLEEKYNVLEKAQLLTREEIVCNRCFNNGVETRQKLARRIRLLSQVFHILKTVLYQWELDLSTITNQKPIRVDMRTENNLPVSAFKSIHEIRDLHKNIASCDSLSMSVSKQKTSKIDRQMNSFSKIQNQQLVNINKELFFTTNKKTDKFPAQIFLSNQKLHFLNSELASIINNNLIGNNNIQQSENTGKTTQFLSKIGGQIKMILNLLKVEILSVDKFKDSPSEMINDDNIHTKFSKIMAELEFYKDFSQETEKQVEICEREILNLSKIAASIKIKSKIKVINEEEEEVLQVRKISGQEMDVESQNLAENKSQFIDTLKKELKMANNEIEKLKNEQSVLLERNKMLKNWNEQALEYKEKTCEELESLKYEKFAMMKKYDEDFEVIREKQERLFNFWKQAEREKETLLNEHQTNTMILKLTQDQNAKLLREIDHHSAVKSLLDHQIQELNTKTSQLSVDNKNLIHQNSEIKNQLEKTINQFNEEKIQITRTIENKTTAINDLLERVGSLKEFNDKITSDLEDLRCQLFQSENEKKNIDVNHLHLVTSHQKMYERFKKTKQMKDTLYSKFMSVSEQSSYFFHTLLEIRDKLNSKTSSIFEDFMIVSHVKNENIVLKTKVTNKEEELIKMKQDFESMLSENEKKILSFQSVFKVLENKFKQMEKGLNLKNDELGFYKKEFEGVRVQNLKMIKSQNENKPIENFEEVEKNEVQILRSENLILREKLKWLSSCSQLERRSADEYVMIRKRNDHVEKEVVAKKIKFI